MAPPWSTSQARYCKTLWYHSGRSRISWPRLPQPARPSLQDQINNAVTQMDQRLQGNAAQTEEVSSTSCSLAMQAQRLQVLMGRCRLQAGALPQDVTPPALALHTGQPQLPVCRTGQAIGMRRQEVREDEVEIAVSHAGCEPRRAGSGCACPVKGLCDPGSTAQKSALTRCPGRPVPGRHGVVVPCSALSITFRPTRRPTGSPPSCISNSGA